MIKSIIGSLDFANSLENKSATFMLALSNTDTAKIDGISQAGIPKMLHLTPILDAEFLVTGEVRSLPDIAKTPKGVPTPALITRAIHLLHPFKSIELLDLGLEIQPNGDELSIYHFNISPSQSIAKGANIDAKGIFEKGFEFAKSYEPKSDYLILGESVPSGTTTATATALALGYDARDLFSSSFKDVPNDIRQNTISQALKQVEGKSDIFEILGSVSDNMLIFVAGFILGVNGRFPLILAGGTQMACALLVANSIAKDRELEFDSSKLALATTKWVAEDKNSDIKALLNMLDFPINAYYSDFDFSNSKHPALQLYDNGEAKEGVGAGGALFYAQLNGLNYKTITEQIESFLV